MQLKRSRKVLGEIRILDLGDAALMVDFRGQIDPLSRIHQLCALLFSEAPEWLMDLIPGIDTLLISLYFKDTQYARTRAEVRALLGDFLSIIEKDKKATLAKDTVHRVRVCYDPEIAPDLIASAEKCKLPLREFIKRHKYSDTRVDILGFMPGFAYCSGLDPSLKLPRLESPRTAVPKGSVAIAELQTGIYPKPTPGGWNVIGRTPDILFDPRSARPSLLTPGDRLEFIEIDIGEFKKLSAEAEAKTAQRKTSHGSSDQSVEVINPGLLTTIQGLPRYGFAHLALSAGGPVDIESARLANALLGNPADAAGLEITGVGPKLLFHVDTWVAWVGAPCSGVIDGKSFRGNRPVRIRKGQTLSFGAMAQGYRVFLAISGGIESEFILGGRGSHLSADIGDKVIQKGDILYLSQAHLAQEKPLFKKLNIAASDYPKWSIASPANTGKSVQLIKAVPSIHFNLLSLEEQSLLSKTVWTVSSQSNRMGMRIDSNFKISKPIAGIASQGIWFGTIQLPPSGQPIIMLAEHQTTGGYPRLLETISSERSTLAQLRPGSKIQFVPITLEEADQINARYFSEQKKTLDNLEVILLDKS
jgi:KipI family sensor histidine kinase inhibitor